MQRGLPVALKRSAQTVWQGIFVCKRMYVSLLVHVCAYFSVFLCAVAQGRYDLNAE